LAFEHQIQVTDTLAYITGIDDDREYCLAIVSKEMGRNVRSFSNEVCVVSDVLNPLDELVLRNASVNSSGGVDLLWYFNANADLSELLINRSERGSAFNPVLDLSNQVFPTNPNLSMDQTALTSQTMYSYQLEAEDECGTETLSGTISTVLLQASSSIPGENNLEWSPFQASGRNFSEYQLCRIETDGSETLISTQTTGPLTYADVLPNPESGSVCYVIKTVHTNNGGDTLVSRSNIACIEQQIGLYIPNAFAPTGFNSVFAPQFVLAGNITNYRMQIFNRWGGKVFESDSPDHGWDGSQSGSLMNTGVYFYLITFQQPDGTIEKRTGTVNLIR
jgi:gliding motility-associated-like protein